MPQRTARAPRQSRTGRPALRWAWVGGLLGLLVGVMIWAPASWLGAAVAQASGGRVIWAATEGSVWRGSATVLLSAGAGSGAPVVLPGRLSWSSHWRGLLPALVLRQDCCMAQPVQALLVPGWRQWQLRLSPDDASGRGAADLGDWPATWLAALGTPWNTLAPSGRVRLQGQDLSLSGHNGTVALSGQLQADFLHMASRLSTLPELGSYRLTVQGPQSGAAGAGPQVTLTTLDGALRLQGQGQLQGGRLRFQGQASAAPDRAGALDNLLNILGRRQGAVALLSVG
ncbi:type II secretion system protein N [Amphibiibacter pelophylacis]|uniref:Type II secretion system protein N n=1 Tax=Amphibiibacter pelophylacis TaxID=1799477 RepID=A0ACC6P3U6_9BURK